MWTLIREQFLKAIVAAVISTLIIVFLWVWGGAYERLKTEVAKLVFSKMEFKVEKSEKIIQVVNFSCKVDDGEQLVSASCVGFDAGDNQQVAVGPFFNQDRSFMCNSYGPVPMKVQATAICFKVAGQ